MKLFTTLILVLSLVVLKAQTTLWSDDFSDPSHWVSTNDVASNENWFISNINNLVTVPDLSPAGFSTVNNGYAFVYSDSSTNLWTVPSPQQAYLSFDSVINLSSSSATSFSLEFEHSYWIISEVRMVKLSADSGQTWTDFIITDSLDRGPYAEETFRLNITDVVTSGGVPSSQVMLKFYFHGDYGSYWAIDDVRIIETPDYDLRVTQLGWLTTFTPTPLTYYQIPNDQIQQVTPFVIVENKGGIDQTNVVANFDISGTTYSVSTNPKSIIAGEVDTLFATSDFIPDPNSSFMVSAQAYSGNIDVDSSDNTMQNQMVVSQIYSRHDGIINGAIYNHGNQYEIGSLFEVKQSQTLYFIDFAVSSMSEGYPLIYSKLYYWDTINLSFEFIDLSDDFVCYSSYFGNVLTQQLCFLGGPIDLTPGVTYLAVIGSYGDGGATHDLVVQSAGKSQLGTSFLFDGRYQYWKPIQSSPMIDLNFEQPFYSYCGGNVEQNILNIEVSQNYPNPFNGKTIVSYSLTNLDNIRLEITDLTGKVLYIKNQGAQTAGDHIIEIDSKGLAAGTYYYSLITSQGRVTKAMNVIK